MAPAYSWFLALRYLLTRWVNVLGIAGLTVAVWALIVVIAVFSGFIGEIREHIRSATADLSLVGVDEHASYEAIAAVLERDADVVSTAPRLQQQAILFPYRSLARRVNTTHAAEPHPLAFNCVDLIGVDAARERRTTGFAGWLDAAPANYRVEDPARPFDVAVQLPRGARPEAGALLRNDPGLLLSVKRMSEPELLTVGQPVDVVSVYFERLIVNGERKEKAKRIARPFAITGAFETKHRFFDDTTTFVDIEVLRSMLGQSADDPDSVDLVTEVAIRTRPDADLQAVAARLQAAAGEVSGGGEVKTWQQLNAVFLGAVEQERALMKLVLFAVMLVAAFLIYATLHMMVTQKIKDIGVLTSMGATPGGIAAIFVLSAFVVAVIGCSLGTLTGIASAHYLNDVNDWCRQQFQIELFPVQLYALDRIPYRIEPTWVLQVLGGAFVLALLIAWLPARRAARMDPVTALSYQ